MRRCLVIFIVSTVMMYISIVTVPLQSFVRLDILRAFLGCFDGCCILSIYFDAYCIIGATNRVRHVYADFTSTEIYRRALVLCDYIMMQHLAYYLLSSSENRK
ncbi:hypothetical protein N7501_001614 [Penicillium viridicatum]|nr:hypothetical protein N7501_001614 [Penicillium viridicatum]